MAIAYQNPDEQNQLAREDPLSLLAYGVAEPSQRQPYLQKTTLQENKDHWVEKLEFLECSALPCLPSGCGEVVYHLDPVAVAHKLVVPNPDVLPNHDSIGLLRQEDEYRIKVA